jgi:transmembrane secretion effector
MSITMRGAEQPFLDLPPVTGEPGRHRTARRRAASYRAVFAIREFRALWWAQVVSYLGDQIAQVAIAVLVYTKTGSPGLTALAYALTYLPPILGGPLLAGLMDVFPRRQVMITLDLVRDGLVELMALPACRWPVPALCCASPCCSGRRSPRRGRPCSRRSSPGNASRSDRRWGT